MNPWVIAGVVLAMLGAIGIVLCAVWAHWGDGDDEWLP